MAGHLLHLDNGAATGQLGNHSLPGSPTGGAAPLLPPSEPAISVGEARKLSLQTEKKAGGFLTGFKKTLRSRKTETSLLYSPPEVRQDAVWIRRGAVRGRGGWLHCGCVRVVPGAGTGVLM